MVDVLLPVAPSVTSCSSDLSWKLCKILRTACPPESGPVLASRTGFTATLLSWKAIFVGSRITAGDHPQKIRNEQLLQWIWFLVTFRDKQVPYRSSQTLARESSTFGPATAHKRQPRTAWDANEKCCFAVSLWMKDHWGALRLKVPCLLVPNLPRQNSLSKRAKKYICTSRTSTERSKRFTERSKSAPLRKDPKDPHLCKRSKRAAPPQKETKTVVPIVRGSHSNYHRNHYQQPRLLPLLSAAPHKNSIVFVFRAAPLATHEPR